MRQSQTNPRAQSTMPMLRLAVRSLLGDLELGGATLQVAHQATTHTIQAQMAMATQNAA